MNQLIKLAFLSTFCLLISCTKDESAIQADVSETSYNGYFRYVLNGDTVESTFAVAQFRNGNINIQARNAENQYVSLLLNNTSEGFYPVDSGLENEIRFREKLYSTIYNPDLSFSSEGSIEITTINESNRTISGQFSGRTKALYSERDIELLEGEFSNVPYSNSADLGGQGYFQFKLNGRSIRLNTARISKDYHDNYWGPGGYYTYNLRGGDNRHMERINISMSVDEFGMGSFQMGVCGEEVNSGALSNYGVGYGRVGTKAFPFRISCGTYTFTEISSTRVRGTLEAIYVDSPLYPKDSVFVTEGEFEAYF